MLTSEEAAPARTPPPAHPSRPAVLFAALVLLVVTVDVWAGGPLTRLDHRLGERLTSWDLRSTGWPRVLLTVGVYFGQRGLVLSLSVVLLALLAWRCRTTEPLLRLVVGLAALAALIYAVKLGLARNAPIQDTRGDPAGTGTSYPSGHVAGAIVLWGLADWSLVRWPVSPGLSRLVHVGRRVAPFAVTVGMTLLNYHWLTDCVAGAAAGVVPLGLALIPGWAVVAARLDRRVWST